MQETLNPEPSIIAETERLIIREFQPNDAAALHTIYSDPEVLKYIAVNPLPSLDVAKNHINNIIKNRQQKPRKTYSFAIVAKKTGELVGSNLLNVELRDRKAEAGIVLRKEAWGQGLATEAQLALMEYGFVKLGVHKIWGTCDPNNTGAKHSMEKTGMKFAAHIRDDRWMVREGKFRDSLLYDMLDNEWIAFKQANAATLPALTHIKVY